ncbi:sphingomyelin phosphodiesterase 2 [Latimeria chalumnae]|uniref:sphingomyelin phosphodiesterase 2 n=1 Tax=Latimeria chalumnae TaxID=7897 RepID=UPI0003C18C97|nr:PREDICTED: sphingomyelin phosphodiesterase 2 isoform X2 [Latimeria chalumnae]|eukprot:XP_005988482.1 PREDICTED: sphingomyelin phosphodiesterase 2 isoform X2 [Latimeria chalumnae]
MSSSPAIKLRVFSLNCWGIRYLSKLCQERFEMIGDLLMKEKHDVVLLQEVWSEKDYLFLKSKLSKSHLYSHYFKSGVIGSGLCVFSRYRILDTFLYRYSVNGYPHMVYHGDWFGGKSVALAIMNIQEVVFHVYVTHLHAEYCREKDQYLPHRVVQAWELAQFIRHTAKTADVVILGGDLNMHPNDLGNRLLRSYTGLRDSFLETETFEGYNGGATLHPENCFSSKCELQPFPNGIRIDYILYKASVGFVVRCERLMTTKGNAPEKNIPYSDHEALTVTIHVRNTTNEDSYLEDLDPELVNVLNEAQMEVKVGINMAEKHRYSSGRMGVLGLVLFLLEVAIALVSFLTTAAEKSFPKLSFYLLGSLAFAVLLVMGILHVFYTVEVRTLQGTVDQMRLAAQARLACTSASRVSPTKRF